MKEKNHYDKWVWFYSDSKLCGYGDDVGLPSTGRRPLADVSPCVCAGCLGDWSDAHSTDTGSRTVRPERRTRTSGDDTDRFCWRTSCGSSRRRVVCTGTSLKMHRKETVAISMTNVMHLLIGY